jgi:serine protease Do
VWDIQRIPMNIPSNKNIRRASIGAAFLIGAAGLFAAIDSVGTSPHALTLKRDTGAVNRGTIESASFAGVVKRVAPSIVKVTVEMNSRRVSLDQGGEGSPFPGMIDPRLRQFFGNRMPSAPEIPESGLGSGVIVSTDGYIVTNNHVVDGAKIVTVTLSDGRDLPARVIGRDPQTDVALIKVDAKGLPAITFATSKNVEVGDRVLAIGNPFGIGETVTTGIVSATSRRAGLGLAYEDFIQTDAAINPGNSGGALVDVDGRLVGINTAILSHSGGFQGVGLAVPADLVGNVVDNIAAHGKVVRGYIGVGIQDLTPGLADSFGIKVNDGALISDVRPGSPAAKAGLKSGDVVTAIDGQAVDSAGRLGIAVAETAPGTQLSLDILRDGSPQRVQVTTVVRTGVDRRDGEDDPAASADDQGVLNGVNVSDVDGAARRDLDLPERLSGAVITSVDPASAAARAGLREGDVILEINRQPVTSAKAAVDLCESAASRKTLVKVWSHGNTVFVVIDETADPADGPQ